MAKDAMRQGDECQSDEGPNRVWRRFWLQLLVALCAVLAVLFIAALFVPVLDVNKRQRVNEAGTVTRLRRLNELQDNYAASNPATRLPATPAQAGHVRRRYVQSR